MPAPRLSIPASSLMPHVDPINHVRHILLQKSSNFDFPSSLVFAAPPTKVSSPYQLRDNHQLLLPNSYNHLSLNDNDSMTVVSYEHLLVENLDVLSSLPRVSEVETTINEIFDTLRYLDQKKKNEWDKQLYAQLNPSVFIISGKHPQHSLAANVLTSHPTDAYHARHVYTMLPVVYASLVLTLVLRFLFNLSRRRTNVVLSGLRDILRLTNVPPEHLKYIPRDSRTVLERFRLDPVTTTYVMCSECYALYSLATTEKTCTNRPTEQSDACGAYILHFVKKPTQARTSDCSSPESDVDEGRENAGGHWIPIKTYTHQSFKHWLAGILCRPGVEDLVDDYDRLFPANDNPQGQGGPEDQDELEDEKVLEDIWDTEFMRNFPDSTETTEERRPFFTPTMKQDGRYAFSLSADSFDPLGNITAKHTISATGINMVLLNFPPHLRHRTENLYHAGIIPGPGKPSNEQINPFIQLIVDEFAPLYEHGVRYSKTVKYPGGRVCKCIIAILVADALAARQIAGFRSVTSYYPCSFCLVTIHDLETLMRPWFERDPVQHREYAALWRDAPTPSHRKKYEELHQVRWSPLLELPYWKPSLSTVIDSMHNLYLGLIQDHCRNIWGIHTEYDSGDGELRPKTIHNRPDSAVISTLLGAIRRGSDMSKLLENLCKRSVSRAALWYICFDYGLRRDGDQYKLARRIVDWRMNHGPSIEELPGPKVKVIAPTPLRPIDPSNLGQLQQAREALMDPSLSVASILKFNKDTLRALCDERHISYPGKSQKLDLVEKLFVALGRPFHHANGTRQEVGIVELEASTPVLGKDILDIIRADMEKTTLPSWIEPAPRNWGTTEHGKLSADQWRVLCVTHLPITLISEWNNRSPRHTAMLANFMDLVIAVRIASMRITSNKYIALYDKHIRSYISGIIELYKDADVKPNHHLSLHLGQFLQMLGPVHAYRTFAFERINYMMQKMNTNARHGQMEKTFLLTACRNANLHALLKDDATGDTIEELLKTFKSFTGESRRGSRLSDFRNSGRQLELIGNPKVIHLDDRRHFALHSSVISAATAPALWVNFFANHRRKVNAYKKMDFHGVSFQTKDSAARDSYITFECGNEIWSGSIDQILLPEGATDIHSTLLLIETFSPLSPEDKEKDPYRLWGFSGGELLYEDFLDTPLVITPTQILGHIAKTCIGNNFGIERSCVHTLPLD